MNRFTFVAELDGRVADQLHRRMGHCMRFEDDCVDQRDQGRTESGS